MFYDFYGGHEVYPPHSPAKRWVETTVSEMYVFLGLTMLMPLAKNLAIHDYWKKDSLITMPAFRKFMMRDRYQSILRFLHFNDNNNIDREDAMYKMRPVYNVLMTRFKNLFRPYKKLVIDESLVLFRGRIAFRQYIRTKRHRFGLKIFVLCDCATGCVLDIMLYAGAKTEIPKNDQLGVSGAVVKVMLFSYLGRGHVFYVNNWYTSPQLCQYLHEQYTGCCGTVRENHKFMPKFPRGEKGQVVKRKCRNILAVKWVEKRDVTVLSTFHKNDRIDSGKQTRRDETVFKPDIIVDYVINMRLVDKSDMMIGSVECVRKTVKWYKKLFSHLVDVCLLNAYLYHKTSTGKLVPFHALWTRFYRNMA